MSLAPAPRHLDQAVATIRKQGDFQAEIGVILGSGLGNFIDVLDTVREMPFEQIPGFPAPTVEGHSGKLVSGRLADVPVLVNAGRVHFYEGYDLEEVIYPVRLLHALGVRTLIITNAAGSTRSDLAPGTLLLLDKLLNLTGRSVIAPDPEPDPLFASELLEVTERVREDSGLNVLRGTYAGLTGPSYETPAEIRFLRHLGADAIGMSTVHESMAAHALGMRLLGISCLTNYAAGILDQPLSHTEVIETGERVKHGFATLLRNIIEAL